MAEHQFTVADDEKVTPVMAYTLSGMYWGDVVTKQLVRVGGWMRSDISPLILELFNAKALVFGGPQPITLSFPVVYIPYDTIIAFHVMPGVQEDLYYDPKEKKRIMLPVNAFVGPFRFDGKYRLSEMTNFLTVMEILKEDFVPLYEVEASHPALPKGGVIKVDFATMKRTLVSWAIPDSPEKERLWNK